MSTDFARIRRILLGFVVGASFGLLIGAIVASWVLGRAAGDAEIGRGTLISIGVAVALGIAGAWVAARADSDAPTSPFD